MEILFVSGFGPVTTDPAASRAFWARRPRHCLETEDDYSHTGALDGVKHYALWPLAQAAESCFGRPGWPADVPVPQAWLELDVDDVAAAAAELKGAGHRLVHGARTMPWGQTLARLLSPEGLLVGVAHTPALRGDQPG